jgi:two-component system, NtrC family, response regulator HupR/HoxA
MVALADDGEFLGVKLMSPEFARLVPRQVIDNHSAIIRQQGKLKDKVESLETYLVTQSLLRHKWNQSRAAHELGISRVGLANKIRRYKLDEKSV